MDLWPKLSYSPSAATQIKTKIKYKQINKYVKNYHNAKLKFCSSPRQPTVVQFLFFFGSFWFYLLEQFIVCTVFVMFPSLWRF